MKEKTYDCFGIEDEKGDFKMSGKNLVRFRGGGNHVFEDWLTPYEEIQEHLDKIKKHIASVEKLMDGKVK